MGPLTDYERQLLERLADAGKPTELFAADLKMAKSLAEVDLVFLVPGTLGRDTAYAIITPKGRHLLAGLEHATKASKGPLGI